MRILKAVTLILFAAIAMSPHADARQIGLIKVASGNVLIDRAGAELLAEPGVGLEEKDTIRTGDNSAVGMTFIDNSRMSLGANSELELSIFSFGGGKGNKFDARLQRGSLTAASGEIAKRSPQAMRVLMPTTVLGVTGTQFAVRIGSEK